MTVGHIEITTVPPLQNQERKHRTFVYVLIVTELLEDWEDSVNIGKALLFFFKLGAVGEGGTELVIVVSCSGFHCAIPIWLNFLLFFKCLMIPTAGGP